MKNIIDVHGNKTRAIYHITIRGTGAWAQIDVRSTGPKAIPEYTIAVDEPDQLVSCMTNAINAAEFLVQKEREKGTLCANISPNNTFIAIDDLSLELITSNDKDLKIPLHTSPSALSKDDGKANLPVFIILLVLVKNDARGWIRGLKRGRISSIEAVFEIKSTALRLMTERRL